MNTEIRFGRLKLLTKTRIKIEPSFDGKGWSVRIGETSWRFARREFAEQFSRKFEDEHFSSNIIEHAHTHNWDRCEPNTCVGALWQIIQGME